MPVWSVDDGAAFGKHMTERIRQARMRAALSAAHRTVEHIVGTLIPGEHPQPVFDGHYRAAWRAEPSDAGADVVNDVPYASVIEGGARAQNVKVGRALIKALTEWVRRKGLAGPRPRGKGKQASHEKECESIAWAIAVDMKRRGIFNRDGKSGLRIAERATKKGAEFFREEFAREMKRG